MVAMVGSAMVVAWLVVVTMVVVAVLWLSAFVWRVRMASLAVLQLLLVSTAACVVLAASAEVASLVAA